MPWIRAIFPLISAGIISMHDMFHGCSSVIEINLGKLDFSLSERFLTSNSSLNLINNLKFKNFKVKFKRMVKIRCLSYGL